MVVLNSVFQEDNVKIFVLLFSGDIKVPLYGMWKPVDVASEYAEKELQHRNIVVCHYMHVGDGYCFKNIILLAWYNETAMLS